MTGLFGLVGLRNNKVKILIMACQPCHTPHTWSMEVSTRQVTGRGLSYIGSGYDSGYISWSAESDLRPDRSRPIARVNMELSVARPPHCPPEGGAGAG